MASGGLEFLRLSDAISILQYLRIAAEKPRQDRGYNVRLICPLYFTLGNPLCNARIPPSAQNGRKSRKVHSES